MKIIPAGHRILIAPDKVEDKSKGGIIIHSKAVEKEQQAQVSGVVLAVGHNAYEEYSVPWCVVGNRILYQRYAGMRIPDGQGGYIEDLLLLNDLDVTGIIEGE